MKLQSHNELKKEFDKKFEEDNKALIESLKSDLAKIIDKAKKEIL